MIRRTKLHRQLIAEPNSSRRSFLGTTAAMVATSTIPSWYAEELRGAELDASRNSNRNDFGIALIGCGGRGRMVARSASAFGRVVAICDVDDRQLAAANKIWPDAVAEKDFRKVVSRKDVDVVVCGTVDHWHALVSIAAMRAGKDVYCEKPLTLTVDEGKQIVRTQQQTGQIVQTGSQQRSDPRYRLACELVRNGRIGKLRHVDVFLPTGRREGPFRKSDVPAGFDWEMWQGPTPAVNYVKQRTHVTFRYWWDYSGGTMTDWGAHHNDIALWGMGMERSGPVTIGGKQLVKMIPRGFTAASEYQVDYTFANGLTHTCRSTSANAWNGAVLDPKGQQHGVKFHGSDGWIWVTRGAIEASAPELLTTALPGNAERLYVTNTNNHMENFFDSVKLRRAPICDAEIGHRSASICHLGVIAMRLGRKLQWKPDDEHFLGDDQANTWLKREMREPWTLDKV